jgi:hypothetical protein
MWFSLLSALSVASGLFLATYMAYAYMAHTGVVVTGRFPGMLPVQGVYECFCTSAAVCAGDV